MRRPAAAVLVLALLVACSTNGGGADADPIALPSTTQPVQPAASGYGPPVTLGYLQDPEVTESSGLAPSSRSPGLFWTHNDSGDGPFIYCVQGSGEPCGTWRMPGADAHDWEDMATGPGPDRSRSYLYVGDIGDNEEARAGIVVYRVPEPAAAAGARGPSKAAPGVTEPAEAIRLRYPDRPHNAEALLVHPTTGDVYIGVKEANPAVYVARAPLSTTATINLAKVATLPLGRDGEYSFITGGAIAPDGTRVALCSYGEGYELRLPAAPAAFDDVWQQVPHEVNLGLRPQGEAITYRVDGKALITTSERPLGAPAPLYQVEQQ